MIGKKLVKRTRAAIITVTCFLLVGLFTSQACMAQGQVRWFSNLQTGLAQAKSSKKWVFVDIGADW